MNKLKKACVTYSLTIDIGDLYSKDQCKEIEEMDYEEAKETIITGVRENIEEFFNIADLKVTVEC